MKPGMSISGKGNKKYIDELSRPVYNTERRAIRREYIETGSECYVTIRKGGMQSHEEL